MKRLKWGIMATGFIASRFAEGLASSHAGELVGVSSRSHDAARAFARKHGAKLAFDSHQSLLGSSEIEAVYIATPHPFHAELAIAAAENGKHVLCEKPLGMSTAEIDDAQKAAEAANVVLIEAYMYRCHPQTVKVCELIRKGKLGKVKLVRASFGFRAPFEPNGRLFNKELGGGAILDVGGYPVSLACLIAETDSGNHTCEPRCHGVSGLIDPRCGVDTIAHATLSFSEGIDAQISVSTQLEQENVVTIFGEDAWLEIRQPWIVSPNGGPWEIKLHRPRRFSAKTLSGSDDRELYGIEADCFAELVTTGKTTAPCMSVANTRCVNRIMEDWQRQLHALQE